jgi:hypothetical protein
MKTETTFWLTLKTPDPNEIQTLTLMLNHVPRVGEIVELDVKLETGERVTRSIRVKDIHRRIKFNADDGPLTESVHIFSS